MNEYRIELLDKRPAMTTTVVARVNGTYQQAVDKAHEVFQKVRNEDSTKVGNKVYSRAVSVHAKNDVFTWHHISMTGVVTDKNTNSGVTYPSY